MRKAPSRRRYSPPKAERQSAILRAEGLSTGLERIHTVAKGLDSNTMQLQYLETLKQVGSSPSTKIVVPMELGGLLNGLRNMLPGDPGRQSTGPGLGEVASSEDAPRLGTITALGEPSS